MKNMTATEMEKINSGHGPSNTAFEISLESTRRETGRPDGIDPFANGNWLKDARRHWPEAPDIIDPELLHKLAEEIREIDTMQ